MSTQHARRQSQHSRIAEAVGQGVIVIATVAVYALLLLAGTAHMSPAERADALLPWRHIGAPVWSLHVRIGDAQCDFDNVFIGDGMVRTGSRCELEKEAPIHARKNN